jgi:ATP-dependent RNA helicase RhlE
MHFSDLGLSKPILRALEHEGYATPTPIQQQAIPHIMSGRDLLGCAQTGTGKTAAFALPILHRLSAGAVDKTRRGARVARALILSPTRELACQIGDSFAAYGRESGLAHAVIYGGVSQARQERALARGVDIIIATPGRLLDLMQQRLIDLSAVDVLVLDEADRMLDMGFIDPIRRIAAQTPSSRQTLLFSATMPRPIAQLAQSLLRDPVRVAVSPVSSAVPAIEQSVYMVHQKSKQALLQMLLGDAAVERVLVFTRTKHGAERVGKQLMRSGISADTIHGNKSQNQRQRALDRFRSGKAAVLVATDVAARGLDVDGITHVVNFDLPVEAEAYIHRIGRTGRAGAAGIALSFCDGEERRLLRDIERLTGLKIQVRIAEGLPPLTERQQRDGAVSADGPPRSPRSPRPPLGPRSPKPVRQGRKPQALGSRGPRRRSNAARYVIR